MSRQAPIMRGSLVNSIHGIPAQVEVLVIEQPFNAPWVISYKGQRYNVHKDNVKLNELEGDL